MGLPVVKLRDLTSLASDTDNRKRIEEFVRNFALIVNNQSQMLAANVPVIEPGDPGLSTNWKPFSSSIRFPGDSRCSPSWSRTTQ